jgi:hypothetical protein
MLIALDWPAVSDILQYLLRGKNVEQVLLQTGSEWHVDRAAPTIRRKRARRLLSGF